MLLYVKGGAAGVREKYRVSDFATGLTIDNGRETRWGGAVGAGLEFGFAPNWSVVDFFFSTGTVGIPAGDRAGTARISQDIDIGLVRVNYRLGDAVAKY